jgi:hypothetical protein
MSSLSMRALGRRKAAVVGVALVAFGGYAGYRTQAGAEAHETFSDQKMTCQIAGAITVSYTLTHTPEAGAVAGQTFTLDIKSTVALNPATPEVAIKTMTITIPTPAAVIGGADIMVMGGNLAGAGQTTEGTDTVLSLTADAGVTSKTLQVPELMIPVEVPLAAAGQSVSFAGPSKLVLGAELQGTPITETCTADASNAPLLTVKPSGGTVESTAPVPTTTTPPTTGGATTTSRPSGATTTGAPTTTVKAVPTPTTSATTATTSATRPSTTGNVSPGQAGAPGAVSASPRFVG